jgi:hypothetical protein
MAADSNPEITSAASNVAIRRIVAEPLREIRNEQLARKLA